MKTETLKNNLRNLALELEYFYTDSSFKNADENLKQQFKSLGNKVWEQYNIVMQQYIKENA
jgi:hypothetical protein